MLIRFKPTKQISKIFVRSKCKQIKNYTILVALFGSVESTSWTHSGGFIRIRWIHIMYAFWWLYSDPLNPHHVRSLVALFGSVESTSCTHSGGFIRIRWIHIMYAFWWLDSDPNPHHVRSLVAWFWSKSKLQNMNRNKQEILITLCQPA